MGFTTKLLPHMVVSCYTLCMNQDERRLELVGLRERLRLKQVAVARACGINRTSFTLWENNHVNLPSETLDRIEHFLNDELAKLQEIGDSEAPTGERRYGIPLSSLLPERRFEREN